MNKLFNDDTLVNDMDNMDNTNNTDNNIAVESKPNIDMKGGNSEFTTVDELADKHGLINCYQIQVDDANNCKPVFLGSYPDVPLPVHKILQYKKYNLHAVTYILTEQEIRDKLFKIVGVNVFRRNRKNSVCSLDLVMVDENNFVGGNIGAISSKVLRNTKYQLIFNDHVKNTSIVVENLEKFPGKDQVLEYVIVRSFEDPVKAFLLK
jgi:hypothetical protein